MLKQELLLFTDASVHPQSQIGYGACLAVTKPDLSLAELKAQVQVRRFESTSSTKLELQTLLWALDEIQTTNYQVIIYTDSQSIIGLSARRERLEQNEYRSKQNRRLNNYQLYQEFFRLTDQIDCQLVKVRGHQASKRKDEIEQLFTLVDRASRQALRDDMMIESH